MINNTLTLSKGLPKLSRISKVNFYLLHALKVDPVVKTVESSVLNFIVQDFFSIFSQTRTKFYSSTVLKLKAKNGIKIITDMLDCERN